MHIDIGSVILLTIINLDEIVVRLSQALRVLSLGCKAESIVGLVFIWGTEASSFTRGERVDLVGLVGGWS